MGILDMIIMALVLTGVGLAIKSIRSNKSTSGCHGCTGCRGGSCGGCQQQDHTDRS